MLLIGRDKGRAAAWQAGAFPAQRSYRSRSRVLSMRAAVLAGLDRMEITQIPILTGSRSVPKPVAVS